MGTQTIYLYGNRKIDIPLGNQIAISNYGGGIAKIYYKISTNEYALQQTLENDAVILGPFSSDMIIKIDAGNSTVIYEVGSSPNTGTGNADLLGGQPPSYYAVDADVVHDTGDESISGNKSINGIDLEEPQNNVLSSNANCAMFITNGAAGGLRPSEYGHFIFQTRSTAPRDVVFVTGTTPSEKFTIYDSGVVNAPVGPIQVGGNDVLVENGVSGTFTTTDGKTITVTNGQITSIV